MIESTAVRDAVTHILCCSCAMCFSAAASSENVQGSMNLASSTAPPGSTRPSRVCRHPFVDGVNQPPLNASYRMARISLIPLPVQVLGRGPELDDEVARE